MLLLKKKDINPSISHNPQCEGPNTSACRSTQTRTRTRTRTPWYWHMTNTPGVETGRAFESECWSENSDTTATETTWRMCVFRLCSSCCSATVTLKFTLTDFLHEGSLTVRQTQLIITVKWLLANYWIWLQTWCWIVFRNTDDDFTRVSSVCTRQTVGDCEELHPSSDTHAAGILIRKLFAVVQHDIEHEGSNLKTTFFFSCVCRCWIDPVHLQRHTVVISKVFSALDFYCSFN